MITKVGVVAGEILNFLEIHREPVSVEDLTRRLEEPEEIVWMSVGWLLRKAWIHLEKFGGKYMIYIASSQLAHAESS